MFKHDHMMGGKEIIEQEVEDDSKFMHDYHMTFLKSIGHFYSWHSFDMDGRGIISRIDHYLGNAMWFLAFPSSVFEYLNHGTSDHTPLWLGFGQEPCKGGRPFKVFNHQLKHEQFQSIAKGVWDQHRVFSMCDIVERVKEIKCKLKLLHKNEINSISEKIDGCRKELDHLQSAMSRDPSNSDIFACEKEIIKQLRG